MHPRKVFGLQYVDKCVQHFPDIFLFLSFFLYFYIFCFQFLLYCVFFA